MTQLERLYEPDAYDTSRLPPSFWAESAQPLPDCDTLPPEADIKAEVAIVGGGYTGLSTALHLAQRGVSVAVFDAGRSGWGASGRNGGFCCLGGARMSLGEIARKFGEDAARQFGKQQLAAIDLVDARIRDWNLSVDRHSDGEVVLAHKPNRLSELQHEAEELAHFAGVKTELLTADDLRDRGLLANGVSAGLHVKAGFGLHPMKYLVGLHHQCRAAGVQIFEQAEIVRIDAGDNTPQSDHYVLHTRSPNTRITAGRVVIATNGYSAENLPDWIGGRLMPVISSILVTRPITASEQAAQGWTSDLMAYDTRILLHYFRKLPDGRMMFGGRGGLNATPKERSKARTSLETDFRNMFPAWRDIDVTHYWDGLACLSRSFRPFVGKIPGHRDMWAALGYHGNGVAMASFAGDLLGRLMQGEITDQAIGPVMSLPQERFSFPGLRRQMRWAAYTGYRFRDNW